MTDAVLDTIAPADVQAQATAAQRDAVAFVDANRVHVTDLATLQQAVQVRTAIGEKQKAIISQLTKPKAWAYGLHKWFCSLEASALAPYELLDTFERQEIAKFKAAEDRARQARERELADERRREEQTRAAAEAAHLETAGEATLAAAVLEESISAPLPVVVLPDVTREVVGLKFRKEWRWRFTVDEARALQLLPREYLCVDTRKLNAYAKAMRSSAALPGVTVYSDEIPIR